MYGTLSASRISKSFGAHTVLRDVSVTVAPGSRIGVVGPNGIGKTTLLRILAGLEEPDGGRVRRDPPVLTVGYLPQELDVRGEETLLSYLRRRTGVAAAEAEVDRLAEALTAEAAQPYADALERYVALGGDDLDVRAAVVCDELGLGASRLDDPVGVLSGGEFSRAALAAILLARFDVFLFDEPTNDLDFEGLDRLESFCSSLEAGWVVVSHDRAFLERTIDRVLEIDEGSHTAADYGGGYAGYIERREAARRKAYEEFEGYVSEQAKLAEQARTIRAWADKGVAKVKKRPPDNEKLLRHGAINRTEKQASKARSIERRIERLDPVEKPFEPWELRLHLAADQRAGHVVVRLDSAVIERGTFHLGPLSLEITWGDRVRVAGPNGCGKTTLIDALLGRQPLSEGDRYAGPSVVFGELDQRRELFADDRVLVEAFRDATGLLPSDGRTLLAKFGLEAGDVLRTGISLSPGERTRANLAALQATGVNCLVLDEPTNHLDLPAIEQLEQALDGYDGTLVVVTHDRRFAEGLRTTRTIDLGR